MLADSSVSVPWVPSRYPNACRLINEIVLGEESDTYEDGHRGHFEVYLEAMREAGADTGPINRLTGKLRQGATLAEALSGSDVPEEAQVFIGSTLDTIRPDKPDITAAAFTFGREDLIPAMFREIALRMIEDLCGDDDIRWAEATNAAKKALEARLRMWDAIADRVARSRDRD
ncbi:MAG: hypothetical protein QOJ99_5229 [Bryobacterales bacterium]|nr:hypothetical protein [Bryobacterales bacterium]